MTSLPLAALCGRRCCWSGSIGPAFSAPCTCWKGRASAPRFCSRPLRLLRTRSFAGATAYLRHGAGQRLWQGFLGILERHPTTIGDEADMIDAAGQAFDLFAQAMTLMTGRVDHAHATVVRA